MSTPIRVRGKNRRDRSGRSLCKTPKLGGKESSPTSSSRREKRRPGRPLKVLTRLTDDGSIIRNSPTSSHSSLRLNSPSACSIDSSTHAKTGSTRRRGRSRAVARVSHLERLPRELLQTVFILSDNLSLPLASGFLAQSLSSRHVYAALCRRACPAAAAAGPCGFGADPDLLSAVLRQPWFTAEFLDVMLRGLGDNHMSVTATTLACAGLPARLVRAPWTGEKVELLQRLLDLGVRVDWINTTIGEEAEQGLRDAILEGCLTAVELLTSEHVGVRSSTELLKLAVFQGGCRQGIVTHLISAALTDEKIGWLNRVDWQDSDIWHFALMQEEDSASSGGDSDCNRGWLASSLKRAFYSHAEPPSD
ncbi:MAG: hypothetical protein M1813_007663 [Trichoglossum hirsutum]|nr:MAG: hypothetical protein M1813_007663 [Trichoglossum hirsutum]